MSEDSMKEAAYRRRRVQRLKKCIILMLMISIAVPIVLCAVLLFRVSELNQTIERLAAQLESLTGSVAAQQAQIEGLAVEEQTGGQGNAFTGEAERASAGYEVEIQEQIVPEEEEAAKPEVTAAHKVYLTFDDGPSSYTTDILDILDIYDVKATFFVVGKETDSAKEAMCDIVARGHTLGMHSYSHKYSEVYASVETFAEDFAKLQEYLKEVTGVESTVYRFPGGSSNTVSALDMREYADYLDSQGVRFFDWNISSGDGGGVLLPVETLVKNSTEDILKNETSVILLHDSADKRTTVEALPIIIENILAMEDTVILPITEDTEPVQHIHRQADEAARSN